MNHTEYNAIEAVRFSKLKRMDISPRHYHEYRTKETEPMRVGRALHLAVLEPGRYPHEVAVWEGATRRGKQWDAFQEENADATILVQKDHDRAMGMQKAVWQDRHASKMLKGGEAEKVREWTCGRTALKCKARIDYATPAYLVDLKSTSKIRPHEFATQAAQLQYHAQLAFYSWGLAVACYIITVTKEAPFDVVVYRLPYEAIKAGRRLCRGWLARVAECEREGAWPGIGGDRVNELKLPEWALADDTPVRLRVGGEEIEV